MAFYTREPDPNAKAPDDVRFLEVHVEPWPDGQKVRVHVELTPFEKQPNLDVAITDAGREDGPEVASTSIIEMLEAKIVFTMHLRGETLSGHYRLNASVSYDNLGQVDSWQLDFDDPALLSPAE